MKAKILLINLIFSVLLSSCSYWEGVFKEADPTIGMSAAQIYGEGKAFLDAEDYLNAIRFFDILEARYPFGIYSTQSMLDLSYASYQSNLKARLPFTWFPPGCRRKIVSPSVDKIELDLN